MGRKVTTDELKVIPADKRTELARLVVEEIGGPLVDAQGNEI